MGKADKGVCQRSFGDGGRRIGRRSLAGWLVADSGGGRFVLWHSGRAEGWFCKRVREVQGNVCDISPGSKSGPLPAF